MATSTADTTSTTDTTTTVAAPPAPQPQSYIMYRTADLMYQPPSYEGADGKAMVPPQIVSSPSGTVISTMTLIGIDGVVVPPGFALVADPGGQYPVGSVYTPPATGSASTTTP